MEKVPVLIRHLSHDDKDYIYSAWLKSYRGNSHFTLGIPASIFFEVHAEVITGILATSRVLVACNQEDDAQIFGFVCYTPSVSQQKFIVHYLLVKPPYQRMGIATALKEAMYHYEPNIEPTAPMIASHMTRPGNFLRIKWKMVYNPYILFRGNYGYSQSV